MIPTIDICGIRVHVLNCAELFQHMLAQATPPRRVMYANAHAINLAQHDHRFRDTLNAADIVFCDGSGVQWAARMLGGHLPERMTPPDWIAAFLRDCGSQQWGIFLLGAAPGVADAAADKLAAVCPGLACTSQHGFFGDDETSQVIASINASGAQVLLVGMGMPKQEAWVTENAHRLNVSTILTVGALFDYIAGSVPRGPKWMTDHGLEWLARLMIEPRRLGKRYLLGNPLFVMHVFRQRLRMLGWPQLRSTPDS